MALDAWLPVGYRLPDDAVVRGARFEGLGWQIFEIEGDGRALVAREDLANRWTTAGLLDMDALRTFQFGHERFRMTSSGPSQTLCPVAAGKAPRNTAEALAFAIALKETRNIDADSPLQDALYVEKFSRLLPTHGITSRTSDDVVLGFWLTGGASVSVMSFRRLRQMLSWWDAEQLKDVIARAGFAVDEMIPTGPVSSETATTPISAVEDGAQDVERQNLQFELPGRPELESFFNEHIVDIIRNRDQYRKLGIGFPSAMILHGPPGTGKTYAIEQLIDFLGWPSFHIDASSVASPYIHETSKKIAEVFDQATKYSPSVLVIDEMEAFFSERDGGAGQYRVEELAEFLRRIPEASANKILVVGMTNRIDLIDPAILRRGRFDHVLHVDVAREDELESLFKELLSAIPAESDLDVPLLAKQFAGRPLSDAAFVVREAARIAVRAGKELVDNESLATAAEIAPPAGQDGGTHRIGFV